MTELIHAYRNNYDESNTCSYLHSNFLAPLTHTHSGKADFKHTREVARDPKNQIQNLLISTLEEKEKGTIK